MAKIQMPDNQSFELDDEMAKDDATLRAALKAAYPDAANATFERSGGKDGKPLVVKVVKKAGTKGGVETSVEDCRATIFTADGIVEALRSAADYCEGRQDAILGMSVTALPRGDRSVVVVYE